MGMGGGQKQRKIEWKLSKNQNTSQSRKTYLQGLLRSQYNGWQWKQKTKRRPVPVRQLSKTPNYPGDREEIQSIKGGGGEDKLCSYT